MVKTATLKRVILTIVLGGLCTTSSMAQCLTTTGPTNNCTYGDAIDLLTINGISASNPGCSGSATGYTAFATPTWSFYLDSTYNLSANLGGAQYNQALAIWIDLNNDGTYQAGEQLYASTAPALNQSGTMTIPATAVTGIPLPMRVMCAYNLTSIPAANACTSNQGTYGETEDYMVTIQIAPPPSNVEATAILQPVDNDCGSTATEVWVRVTNTTVTDETNIPIVVNVSGIASNNFSLTIPSILGMTFKDTLVGVIDTEAGGSLNLEFYTDFADNDADDDTLVTSISLNDATALSIDGPTEVCSGDSALYEQGNPGIESFTWTLDGVTVENGNPFYQSGPMTANAQLVISSDNLCRANDTLDITINPLPTGSFTSSTSLNVVDFTGTAADFDGIDWDFGDGTTGTGLTAQNTYAQNGTYTVCMSAYNQCDTVVFCDDVTISNVGLLELATGTIKVYPNPTSDVVTITLSDLNGFKGDWSLVDLDGKVLQKGAITISSDKTELNLSLEAYSKGAYLFNLSNKHGQSHVVSLVRE